MAPLVWTLRVYWKRYTFGAVASVLFARYASKKFRDNNVVRAYCNQAKKYGEERVGAVESDGRPRSGRKVTVFLNPSANKREAKIQFLKYSSPLFFLSGVDITVVESQHEGHLRMLMNYIDPQTDCIVVAGGDGTLMEAVTGLMRRTDANEVRSIPIGVIPLGRENQYYWSNLSSTRFKSPVRAIGDATMDIIRGEKTTPIHIMEMKPESGRMLYALSSLQWGPLRDAYENRDGFRLFGKLRLLVSHLNVALRKWPTDYVLHLWHPRQCSLEDDSGSSQPPPRKVASSPQQSAQSGTQETLGTTQYSSLLKKHFSPAKVHCVRPRYTDLSGEDEKRKSSSSSPSPATDRLEPTKLAEDLDLEHRELRVMGFHLSVHTEKEEEEEGEGREKEGGGVRLALTMWMDGSIHKGQFIKQGWLKTLGRSPAALPSLSLTSPHLVVQPHSHTDSWVSIDGEVYEAMPVAVRTVPNAFRVFSRKTA